MKFKPLISVIIPYHRKKKFFVKTINSILNQSYKNFEYIIIDGKSKDSTLEIIKSKKNNHEKYIHVI